MRSFDKRLPYGEASGFGQTLFVQDGQYFRGDGAPVTVKHVGFDDGENPIYEVTPIELPKVYPVLPPLDPSDKPAPIDPLPQDWWNVPESVLRTVLAAYGEKYEDRELAIMFLKSEGKTPHDLDA